MKKSLKIISVMLITGGVIDVAEKVAHAVVIHHALPQIAKPTSKVPSAVKGIETHQARSIDEGKIIPNNSAKGKDKITTNGTLSSEAKSTIATTNSTIASGVNNGSVTNDTHGEEILDDVLHIGGYTAGVTLVGAGGYKLYKWRKYKLLSREETNRLLSDNTYKELNDFEREINRLTMISQDLSVRVAKGSEQEDADFDDMNLLSEKSFNLGTTMELKHALGNAQQELASIQSEFMDLQNKVIRAELNSGRNYTATRARISILEDVKDDIVDINKPGPNKLKASIDKSFNSSELNDWMDNVNKEINALRSDMYRSQWKNGEFKDLPQEVQNEINQIMKSENISVDDVWTITRLTEPVEIKYSSKAYKDGFTSFYKQKYPQYANDFDEIVRLDKEMSFEERSLNAKLQDPIQIALRKDLNDIYQKQSRIARRINRAKQEYDSNAGTVEQNDIASSEKENISGNRQVAPKNSDSVQSGGEKSAVPEGNDVENLPHSNNLGEMSEDDLRQAQLRAENEIQKLIDQNTLTNKGIQSVQSDINSGIYRDKKIDVKDVQKLLSEMNEQVEVNSTKIKSLQNEKQIYDNELADRAAGVQNKDLSNAGYDRASLQAKVETKNPLEVGNAEEDNSLVIGNQGANETLVTENQGGNKTLNSGNSSQSDVIAQQNGAKMAEQNIIEEEQRVTEQDIVDSEMSANEEREMAEGGIFK